MPKHRRALCLLYFSTKSFYVNLSNIKCHSEVSLSGSSRLASAKVRRSYLTTKLSSHFFHGPPAENMHISCTKPSKTADLRPEKIFQLFWPRTANMKRRCGSCKKTAWKQVQICSTTYLSLSERPSPLAYSATCTQSASISPASTPRARRKPWNKTQMPW